MAMGWEWGFEEVGVREWGFVGEEAEARDSWAWTRRAFSMSSPMKILV